MRIYLTGFMGAGKTFLGKLWAEDNSLSFFDLDLLIEDEERMSVEKIFSTYGEDYFREKEAAVLRNTDRFDDCIIACGGGTPCFFDNMNWMNQHGTTIFLNTPPTLLAERLRGEKEFRPLLRSVQDVDLLDFIIKKLEERAEFYLQANIILEQIVGDEEFLEKLVARVQGRVTSP